MSASPVLQITKQGKPQINIDYTNIVKSGRGFIAMEIDMKSKWCEISGVMHSSSGLIGISLRPTDRSTNLANCSDDETDIEIGGLNGVWEIFCCNAARYTIYLVIIKR